MPASHGSTWVVTTPAAARIPRSDQPAVRQHAHRLGRARPIAGDLPRRRALASRPRPCIVDISHEIDKYNIRHGALMLWCALPYLPIGAHMAVVDPGVGTHAPAVALETGPRRLPRWPGQRPAASPARRQLGGIIRVHVIDNIAVPPAGTDLDVPRPRPVRAGRGPPGAGRAARGDRPGDRPGRAGRDRLAARRRCATASWSRPSSTATRSAT